VFELSKS